MGILMLLSQHSEVSKLSKLSYLYVIKKNQYSRNEHRVHDNSNQAMRINYGHGPHVYAKAMITEHVQ